MADDIKTFKNPIRKIDRTQYPQRLPVWNDPRMELMGLRGHPLGEDILAYLQQRNRVPEIDRGSYLGEGVSGRFTSFLDGQPKNLIELIYNAYPSTRQHEFAHAADHELARQYDSRKTNFGIPDEPTQFTNAYEKLVGGRAKSRDVNASTSIWRSHEPGQSYVNQRQWMANKLNPEWTNKNKDYRATNKELIGWGAGNQIYPETRDMGPQHLDSTMATELAILIDLAMRENKKK